MGTIKFIVISLFAVFAAFNFMNSSMVQNDARIVLSKSNCPVNLNQDGLCVIQGSISRSFFFDDLEIRLDDNSVLLVKQDQLQGYVLNGDTEFKPFGKFFAFAVGILIIIGGFILALYSSDSKKN